MSHPTSEGKRLNYLIGGLNFSSWPSIIPCNTRDLDPPYDIIWIAHCHSATYVIGEFLNLRIKSPMTHCSALIYQDFSEMSISPLVILPHSYSFISYNYVAFLHPWNYIVGSDCSSLFVGDKKLWGFKKVTINKVWYHFMRY